MLSTWSSMAPTHLLYDDDILIFCSGTVDNLKTIVDLLTIYGNLSGQRVNWEKSHMFFGSCTFTAQRMSMTSIIWIAKENHLFTLRFRCLKVDGMFVS